MITVAFTVSCLREKYLRAAIDCWARARGSDQARFVFCLEPPGTFPVADFTAYVEQLFPGGALVFQNAEHLGCLRNTKQAMSLALKLSDDDFAVVTEEDLEVADDILEYLAWARDAYRGDERTIAACAHARTSDVTDPAAVVRASWFNPLVWGTWADRWEGFIAPQWGPHPTANNRESWDCNLQEQVRDQGKLCVFPGRSRVVHRGRTSTISPTLLAEYYYVQFKSDCYRPHYEPQAFHEITDIPGQLVV